MQMFLKKCNQFIKKRYQFYKDNNLAFYKKFLQNKFTE